MTHDARRLAALAILAPLCLVGCKSDAAADGDRPGVIGPTKSGQSILTDASASSAKLNDPVIARIESVTVTQSELVPLLYDAYGLDGLLKLLLRNMARAEAARRGATVSKADIDAERNITLSLAFPGEKSSDYDNLLNQLLQRDRIKRPEFDLGMDTNAHLRACVRGQASSGVTQEAIRNEFNMTYGERIRVRDIPVSNPQEAAEVKRLLAEPGARFEVVARRMGKVPALAELGGQLAEFARTTPGYSPLFIETAFALEPGQVSDPILEGPLYHILKLEERVAPKVIKFEDVQDDVRQRLIVRRTNNLMAALRQELAQRALAELKIEEPSIRRDFEERRAAANPKPADRGEVQRSLEQPAATRPATEPATAPAAPTAPAVPAATSAPMTR